MLSVTRAAAEQLSELLQQTDAQEQQGIRLVQNEGKLALLVDAPQQGDQVVEAGERPLLILDPALSEALDGVTLDAVETPTGGRELSWSARSRGAGHLRTALTNDPARRTSQAVPPPGAPPVALSLSSSFLSGS